MRISDWSSDVCSSDLNAEIFAVGNTSLSELKPLLEKSFGLWRMTRDMKGRKTFDVPTPAAQQRIILVNRPQSPHSVILAGEVLDAQGTAELLTLIAANDVMGGNLLSRMTRDLRESKGCSYALGGTIKRVKQN